MKIMYVDMDLEALQRIAQITFYITVAIVTVLTFLRAKKGLLSNVNTEYHKRVIERLDRLSNILLEEYDFDSPNHWSKKDPIGDCVAELNKTFLANKDEILQAGKFPPGIPDNPDSARLYRLVERIKSDPFIPKEIRDKAVDLLGNRADVIIEVHLQELERYSKDLAKGRYRGELDWNKGVIHNRVISELRKRGCGIEDIEEEVHKLRLAIQEYFRKFNP